MTNTSGQAVTVFNTTGYDSSTVNTTEAIIAPLPVATGSTPVSPVQVLIMVVAVTGFLANLFVLITSCVSPCCLDHRGVVQKEHR
jgi:hypothetical protein